MRRTLILLTPLLLAGCIKDSATYYAAEDSKEHAITVRAEQEYFWNEALTISLVAANMPDCQRRCPLDSAASAEELAVELFTNGDGVYTVRSGAQVVQIDTKSCTRLADPAPNALGDPVGVYRFDEERLSFTKVAAPAPAPAA